MSRVIAFTLVLLAVSEAAATDSRWVHFIHRQGAATLPALFSAELAAARSRKEQVVVIFTADWCAPCKSIKEFLNESAQVQRSLKGGHLLFIDVDEWRGPAQSLLPGIDASKLPTVVRVDTGGKVVLSCYGTDLGLLSEDAVGQNLARLIAGKAPVPAAYEKDGALTQKLVLQQAQAQQRRTQGVPQVEATVRGVGAGTWTLRLVLRNHDGPRRWFLVPADLDQPLTATPRVTRMASMKFEEHVRALYIRFDGEPGFVAIPVAGYGEVVLDRWPVRAPQGGGELEVWELDRLTLDGTDAQFDHKLPYELSITNGGRARELGSRVPGRVEIAVKRKHRVGLDP